MPTTNFPQGVSSFGMPVLPVGGLGTVGNVFWVNSLTGTDANGRGTDPTRPFKTINFALTKCVAPGGTNPQKPGGDFILVMPGHLEQISVAGSSSSPSGSISVNVAGVTIIGLGNGTSKPTIQWSQAAGQMLIGAANTTFYNILFDTVGGGANVTAAMSITAARPTFRYCEFVRENAVNACAVVMQLNTGWGFFLMEDCWADTVAGGAAGGTRFIQFAAAGDNFKINRSKLMGQFSTATIGAGANVITNIALSFVWLDNQASNKPVIDVPANTTGRCEECFWTGVSWTAVGVAASSPIVNGGNLVFRQCFGVATLNKNGTLSPAAAGTI